MVFPSWLFGFAALAATLAACPSRAETFKGEYTVSYLGLTVARTAITSEVDGNAFSISGSMKSAGIGTFFDSTKGTLSVAGGFAKTGPMPTTYRTDYTDGPKTKMTALTFKGGKVTKVQNVPPVSPDGDWVPVTPGDLVGVADPMSATLIKAGGLDQVCRRTLKVFDGEMRIDLQLSPGPPSRDPMLVTCRARFKPVAGYRKGRKTLDYLAKKSIMMFTFGQLGSTGIYAPIKATIGTQIGTITIKGRPA